MTYTALDVSRYIVSYCFNKDKPITNLKLQSILYNSWVDFYKSTRTCLFLDEFCAWRTGPAIPEAYYEFCPYGGRSITEKFNVEIDVKDKELLNIIIDKYISVETKILVDKNTRRGTPWDLTFKDGVGMRKTIPVSLIMKKELNFE